MFLATRGATPNATMPCSRDTTHEGRTEMHLAPVDDGARHKGAAAGCCRGAALMRFMPKCKIQKRKEKRKRLSRESSPQSSLSHFTFQHSVSEGRTLESLG